MGWITLYCTRHWPGIWSIDFFFLSVFEVEKKQRHRVHLMFEEQRAGYGFGRWDAVQLLLRDDGHRSVPIAGNIAGMGMTCGRRADTEGLRRTVKKSSWLSQDLGGLCPRFLIGNRQRAWCLWKVLHSGPSQQGRRVTCSVCLWCYGGYSPARFPCCFPKKSIPGMAFSSLQRQAGQVGHSFRSRAGRSKKLH